MAPLELLACGRKLRITCAVLSRLGRQGSLPFRTFAGLLFMAGLRRLAHIGFVIGGGAETSLEGVKLILNVGDRLTEGLSCTPGGGSGALYALTVLVRLESTFLLL